LRHLTIAWPGHSHRNRPRLDAQPSPQPGVADGLRAGGHRLRVLRSINGYVAMVAEVSEPDSRAIRVVRLVVGRTWPLSIRRLRNQIGRGHRGISRAGEEVTWDGKDHLGGLALLPLARGRIAAAIDIALVNRPAWTRAAAGRP
jgi:hypothetical protein